MTPIWQLECGWRMLHVAADGYITYGLRVTTSENTYFDINDYEFGKIISSPTGLKNLSVLTGTPISKLIDLRNVFLKMVAPKKKDKTI